MNVHRRRDDDIGGIVPFCPHRIQGEVLCRAGDSVLCAGERFQKGIFLSFGGLAGENIPCVVTVELRVRMEVHGDALGGQRLTDRPCERAAPVHDGIFKGTKAGNTEKYGAGGIPCIVKFAHHQLRAPGGRRPADRMHRLGAGIFADTDGQDGVAHEKTPCRCFPEKRFQLLRVLVALQFFRIYQNIGSAVFCFADFAKAEEIASCQLRAVEEVDAPLGDAAFNLSCDPSSSIYKEPLVDLLPVGQKPSRAGRGLEKAEGILFCLFCVFIQASRQEDRRPHVADRENAGVGDNKARMKHSIRLGAQDIRAVCECDVG